MIWNEKGVNKRILLTRLDRVGTRNLLAGFGDGLSDLGLPNLRRRRGLPNIRLAFLNEGNYWR